MLLFTFQLFLISSMAIYCFKRNDFFLSVIIFVLQIYTFLLPTNIYTTSVTYIFLFVGLFFIKKLDWRVALTCFVSAILFSRFRPVYDSGLYHYPQILLNNTYGQLLGAVNLHERYGFNSFILTLSSFFSWFKATGQDFHIGNALIVVWGLFPIVVGVLNGKMIYYCSILFVMLWRKFLFFEPGMDQSQIIIVVAFVSLLFAKDLTAKWGYFSSALLVITKVSFLPIALGISILTFLNEDKNKRLDIASLLPAVVISVSWVISNFLLSGCLVYPAVQTCFDVSWGIEKNSVIQMKDIILAWARSPGSGYLSSLGNYEWIEQWWPRVKIIVGRDALLFFLSILFLFKSKNKTNTLIILLTCIVQYLFWFMNAPDVRFIYPAIFSILILTLCQQVFDILNRRWPELATWKFHRHSWLLLVPFLFLGDYRKIIVPKVNIPAVEVYKNSEKDLISFPKNGDQCWLSDPLCVPSRLKKADEILKKNGILTQ